MQLISRQRVDVAIIGGGITGCAAAWYLANEGVSVALLEAGELNAQASGSNAGSLHAQIPQDTFLELGDGWAQSFAPTLKLLRGSIALWRQADEALDGALEVRINGGLMLASTPEEMQHIERKARFEQAAGTETRILSATDLRAMAPYLSPHLVGAGFCTAEGKANPLVAATTFARSAQAAGAQIHRNQAVLAIGPQRGRYRLNTPDLEVDASRVIIAAGAGTPSITKLLGSAKLDIQSVPIQMSVTEPVAPLMSQLLYYARAPLTMKQTDAGTILIGGGWPARLDAQRRPVPDPHSLGQNLGLALEVVPALANITLMRTWAATVNGTDDWKPIIGELPGSPGVYLGYVPWMGFTGGPAAARIVASMVQDREPSLGFDVGPFAPR
ncbi:MAG: sarcosine oxidase subunit beta [Glaciecola sp.]|jgi:sarcosine oxidase subunit beta